MTITSRSAATLLALTFAVAAPAGSLPAAPEGGGTRGCVALEYLKPVVSPDGSVRTGGA